MLIYYLSVFVRTSFIIWLQAAIISLSFFPIGMKVLPLSYFSDVCRICIDIIGVFSPELYILSIIFFSDLMPILHLLLFILLKHFRYSLISCVCNLLFSYLLFSELTRWFAASLICRERVSSVERRGPRRWATESRTTHPVWGSSSW